METQYALLSDGEVLKLGPVIGVGTGGVVRHVTLWRPVFDCFHNEEQTQLTFPVAPWMSGVIRHGQRLDASTGTTRMVLVVSDIKRPSKRRRENGEKTTIVCTRDKRRDRESRVVFPSGNLLYIQQPDKRQLCAKVYMDTTFSCTFIPHGPKFASLWFTLGATFPSIDGVQGRLDMTLKTASGTRRHISCVVTEKDRADPSRGLVIHGDFTGFPEQSGVIVTDTGMEMLNYQSHYLMARLTDGGVPIAPVLKHFMYMEATETDGVLLPRHGILMEKMTGTLETFFKPSPGLPQRRRVNLPDIFCRLKDALVKTHESGVAHCDIKNQNILVDLSRGTTGPGSVTIDNLVLADWGLPMERDEPVKTMEHITTVPYQCPEMYASVGQERTFESFVSNDIYSFGVCVMLMLPQHGRLHTTGAYNHLVHQEDSTMFHRHVGWLLTCQFLKSFEDIDGLTPRDFGRLVMEILQLTRPATESQSSSIWPSYEVHTEVHEMVSPPEEGMCPERCLFEAYLNYCILNNVQPGDPASLLTGVVGHDHAQVVSPLFGPEETRMDNFLAFDPSVLPEINIVV